MDKPTTYHCHGAYEDHLHATDSGAVACNEDQQSERDQLDREDREIREDRLVDLLDIAEGIENYRQDWRATR